ncbi:hypothetical protein GCM10007860_00960 [Chitiniphilus shinanonensis]|uniref:Type VI secretion system (T6SS), amidase effector protein 4 n=2 Tax=Chitiniphilus shinanonensis TaxID=553088 RepID=A0ABQ6BLX4_9NEIS|nr:hypothetical protein GCM10007860_00960 [Chitiniphilus shinanonensis]
MLSAYQNMAENKSTGELFADLFGPNYDQAIFFNSCATRVSIALLNSGVKSVGSAFNIQQGPLKGKGITTSAVGMKNFLKTIWGSPEVPDFKTDATTTLADLQASIGSRTGVFSFVSSDPRAFGATGHITIWNGTDVVRGAKYDNQAYANGNPGTACLWELK